MDALVSSPTLLPPHIAATPRCRSASLLLLPHRPEPANDRIASSLRSFATYSSSGGGGGGGDRRWWKRDVMSRASSSSSSSSSLGGEGGDEEDERRRGGDDDVERALGMDGSIPGSSEEFVKRVSSRAYDMRRHLEQTIDSVSYDVLENNPWREDSKPVYVLTQRENLLCTMKTRRNRSEVERELGLLFSKGGKRGIETGNKAKHSKVGTKFSMFVEDIQEGVLVFEDENDAAKYCDLLQGGGQGCEGIAELEASSVFDICRKMRALAVLFRRGRTPPLPKSLEQNLRARKRSLEDN